MRLSEDQEITFEKFKKISRKFHKSRRFTATNKWCAEYIKSYGLENIIEIPPHMKWFIQLYCIKDSKLVLLYFLLEEKMNEIPVLKLSDKIS